VITLLLLRKKRHGILFYIRKSHFWEDKKMSDQFNATKVKNDIQDLKDKKSALSLSLTKDMEALMTKITESFCELGKTAYEKRDAITVDLFSAGFEAVDKLYNDHSAKAKKIEEIAARYDDEIEIMEKLLPEEAVAEPVSAAASPAATPAGAKAFCMNCGNEYKAGVDMFCMNCGTKTQ
jgi:hypothetical protein